MPTFTAMALDRLIEPGASKSAEKSRPPPRPPPKPKPIPRSNLERRHSTSSVERKVLRPPQIKPQLYATPESTPLPDSPTSFPPSPYVINHKRRGPRLLKSLSEKDVTVRGKALDEQKSNSNEMMTGNAVISSGDDVVSKPTEEEGVNGFHDGEVVSAKARNGSIDGDNEESTTVAANNDAEFENGKFSNSAVEKDSAKIIARSPQRGVESGDFLDPQHFKSSANADGEDNGAEANSATQGEFFDAWDELSSDGGTQSSLRDVEAELCEIRLSLLMEIESRKQAEEALNNMRTQWEKIQKQLLLVGLTLPADPIPSCEDGQPDADSVEDLCQKVTLARYVSESIGRGIAKAETEEEMEVRIESKNFEIARLTDRLNYYEAMNREMSQRNQEAVEMARRNRQKRKRKLKWVWGSVAAAITLGTAAIVWSYVPMGNGSPSTNHTQDLEQTDTSK